MKTLPPNDAFSPIHVISMGSMQSEVKTVLESGAEITRRTYRLFDKKFYLSNISGSFEITGIHHEYYKA